MKKTITLLFVALVSFSSCKKEGCTESTAKNFDSEAKKDDESCTYEGSLVFWYQQNNATELGEMGVVSLTYVVDGAVVGSSAASVYWTGAPDCGQNGTVTVTKDLGVSKSKSFPFLVKDQDGDEIYSGTVTIEGGKCTTYELE